MYGEILQATSQHSTEVSQLVAKLLVALVGHKREIDTDKLAAASSQLLSEAGGFSAFLYLVECNPIGVITISRSAAIYAGGYYGVIEEFYVEPEYRSQSIGKTLLKKAIQFSREQGWPRLEVSTPEKKKWQRIIDFYYREGFSDNSNGERLKLIL
ncbi:GNAT family N-acetyltransferase [uncultured Microbulbifer sp.]|uniref:GNAT family N-acetyltransferase n=1 Tax=uncultured Microbulbifer sp. TaxID=348147 RepID=UPI002625F04E|nr:GNAT family N-acetyltransferase [uncultured Microbulbifer sp.]